jgi:hypothetical protein
VKKTGVGSETGVGDLPVTLLATEMPLISLATCWPWRGRTGSVSWPVPLPSAGIATTGRLMPR